MVWGQLIGDKQADQGNRAMFFIVIYQLLEKCGHNASTKQYSVKSIFYAGIARLPWQADIDTKRYVTYSLQ